ncbi:MAG: hypothetical protein SFV54_07445 [Bryobacteraceae bacterium]|nr:hypothetical protein [Bryobacteraceae bacterium]
MNLACHETGARSISDLARHALQRMIDPPPGGPEQALMVTRLQVMDDMIRELNGKLEQLSQLLVALRSSEPGGPAADGSGK